jgi:hypothetical protein
MIEIMVRQFTSPLFVTGLTNAFILASPQIAIAFGQAILQTLGNPSFWINIARAFLAAIVGSIKTLTGPLGAILASVLKTSAQQFADEILNGAVRFVDSIINQINGALDSINPFSSGGGDKGNNKGLFGLPKFAEGGRVPDLAQFRNDGAISRLSAGEQVLSNDLSGQLESFLSSGGQGQNLSVNLVIGEQQLANVLLNLNRQGFRVA